MAILKNKEIRALGESQREDKLRELRKELIKVRSQIALGSTPENPGRIREIRRTIARILTIKKTTQGGKSKKDE